VKERLGGEGAGAKGVSVIRVQKGKESGSGEKLSEQKRHFGVFDR